MDAPRRCYYEILGITERKCDEDEIRRAYKKSALRCHPDRNHGNEEAAALEFKEVQNAYTVLIDPDERAWYDNHREAILRGDDGGGSACAPDELNVFDYFSARVYDDFEDSNTTKGFYNVYRKVFDTIVKEESQYNDKISKTAPSFGDSKTPWSQLSQFYTFWKHFITNKTFAWKDEHKLNEIPDRFFRREAERVNLKARAQARKEYISVVQQLAHHIYIRDPRVAAQKAQEEKEREEKAAERERKDAEAAKRRREANQKIWEEAAEREAKEMEERIARGEDYDGAELEMLYEKQRQLERATKKGDKKAMREAAGAHCSTEISSGGGGGSRSRIVVGGFGGGDGDAEEEEDADEIAAAHKHAWKCHGCKKNFSTEKTFKEHVSSSKHKTKFKQLEKQGIDLSTMLVTPNDVAAGSNNTDNNNADNDNGNTKHDKDGGEEKKKNKNSKKGGDDNDSDDDDEKEKSDDDKKEKKKQSSAASASKKKGGKNHHHHDNDSDDEIVTNNSKKAAAAAAPASKKKGGKHNHHDDEDSDDNDKKPAKKGDSGKKSDNNNNSGKNKKKKNGNDSDNSDDGEEDAKPSAKFQKSKAKAAAKAAAAASDDDEESEEEEVIITTKNKFSFGKRK